MLAQTFGKPAVSTARYGTRTLWGSFSAGPGKTCCRNKRQQEESPVGLEAGNQLKSQGKWLGVGGTFLWDFTYLCWNLTYMSEWRSRYHGDGVLVYWHVETGAVCIYSQLRSFSSSEVAAMIEGLVRHNTEMRVEKNFVDSHGQSEVAFAFCHLLGTVRLMPRLKRIKYERLYLPAKGIAGEFLNLIGVLT